MNDIERALLKDQITADTVWCFSCALSGAQAKAACRYGVEGTTIRVPACPRCLQQAMADHVKITDVETVAQPQHVETLERLITQSPHA